MCFRKLCIEAGRAPKKVVFCLQILMLNVAEKNPQKPPQTHHTPPKSCEKYHDSRIIRTTRGRVNSIHMQSSDLSHTSS